ncbi:hypothetical protein PTSG_09541 [Salpingoeca rosetta]|uniref:Uncharacterized protein n=1 Tax=Salpingoeca rosetta (strain ATCC 50818 / BSB-021) TaxID=946362 RepID=F2ULA7_SALR5|nr:uncharacterized protein PTSG_09541 [Salpingoeca rosetta]EGD77906.1 hypothetical protein PTSG_09541 [Salpingoeca rosetta]|eukprot:XP_004989970.1 hypothetical protein PTSG_09541 [Salpingoeca rosetta]
MLARVHEHVRALESSSSTSHWPLITKTLRTAVLEGGDTPSRKHIEAVAQSWYVDLHNVIKGGKGDVRQQRLQAAANTSDNAFAHIVSALVGLHMIVSGMSRRHLSKAMSSLHEHYPDQTRVGYEEHLEHLLRTCTDDNAVSVVADIAALADVAALSCVRTALEQLIVPWIKALSAALRVVRDTPQDQLNEASAHTCVKAYVLTLQQLDAPLLALLDEEETGAHKHEFEAIPSLLADIVVSTTVREVALMSAMGLGYTVALFSRNESPSARATNALAALALGTPAARVHASGLATAAEALKTIHANIIGPFASTGDVDWSVTMKQLSNQQLQVSVAVTHALLSTLSITDLCAPIDLSPITGQACEGVLLLDVLLPFVSTLSHSHVSESLRHSVYNVFRAWSTTLATAAEQFPHVIFSQGALRAHTGAPSLVHFLEATLFRDWEDPIEAVRDGAAHVFRQLLNVDRISSTRDDVSPLNLASSFTTRLIAFDWRVKGRYALLAMVVPHMGWDKLLAIAPRLKHELLLCCGINTLIKPALTVYVACLKDLRQREVDRAESGGSKSDTPKQTKKKKKKSKKDKGGVDHSILEDRIASRWHAAWSDLLLDVLASDAPGTSDALSATWLVKTTKVVPRAVHILIAGVSAALDSATGDGAARLQLLRRYALLLSNAKKSGFITSHDLEALRDNKGRNDNEASADKTCPTTETRAAPKGTPSHTTAANSSVSATALHLSLSHIREALTCSMPTVRLDTLRFVCVNVQTSGEPAEAELSLFRAFLPHNLANTTSALRQRLFADVSAMLQRLRDSWVAANTVSTKLDEKVQKQLESSKTPQPTPKDDDDDDDEEDGDGRVGRSGDDDGDGMGGLEPAVMRALDEAFATIVRREDKLVSTCLWMIDLCDANLFPGSCYQRRCSALQLLTCLVDVVGGIDWSVCPPPIVTALENLLPSLVHGLQDNFDDTRNATCNLLVQIHGLASASEQPEAAGAAAPVVKRLWSRFMGMIDNAKAMIAETAAAYARAFVLVAFSNTTQLQQQKQRPAEEEAAVNAGSDEGVPEPPASPKAFVQFLLARAEQQLQFARTHTLQAAKTKPMHGTLQALHLVLDAVAPHMTVEWEGLLSRVVDVSTQAAEFCLSLLTTGVSDDTRAMPSFQDMGTSLTQIVRDQGGDVQRDFPFMLSFMWLNIRTACRSLASVAVIAARAPPKAAGSAVDAAAITAIKEKMCLVLKRCRHRGVIESTALSLTTVAQHLMQSKRADLRPLPQQWLAAEIALLETDSELETLSVTRRSAGLPHVVHSLALARKKGSRMLHPHLEKLIALAGVQPSSDTHASSAETQDMRQVHCFNVLKVLFAESLLNSDTQQYVSPAMVLAIRGFSSPVWSIRNASLQLFGILLPRVLGGVRLETENRAISITTQDFIARYGDVWVLLLQELTTSTEQSAANIQTHLFAVMTLLSKLRTVSEALTATAAQQLQALLAALMKLTASPILAVRCSAARALAGLLPPEDKHRTSVKWARDVFSFSHNCDAPSTSRNHNRRHGLALSLAELLRDELASTSELIDHVAVVAAIETQQVDWQQFVQATSPFALATHLDVLGVLWQLCCERATASPPAADTPAAEAEAAVRRHLQNLATATLVLTSRVRSVCGADKALFTAGTWLALLLAHASSQDNGDADNNSSNNNSAAALAHALPALESYDAHLALLRSVCRRRTHASSGAAHAETVGEDSSNAAGDDGADGDVGGDTQQDVHAGNDGVWMALVCRGLSCVVSSPAFSHHEKQQLLLEYAPLLERLLQAKANEEALADLVCTVTVAQAHIRDECARNASLQEAWLVVSGLTLATAPGSVDVGAWLAAVLGVSTAAAPATAQLAALRSLHHARFALASLHPQEQAQALQAVAFHLLAEDERHREMASAAATPLLLASRAATLSSTRMTVATPANEHAALHACFKAMVGICLANPETCGRSFVNYLWSILFTPSTPKAEGAATTTVLFAAEDLNPYAEQVHMVQLAMQSLLALCHPGINNSNLERLASFSTNWKDAAVNGQLARILQEVIVDNTPAVAAHLKLLLLNTPPGAQDDNLDGKAVVALYRAFSAFAACVYVSHVLAPALDEPLDWMDPTILDMFPGLLDVCLAWQGRSDLHHIRMLRSAAFVLNRAVFARHRPNPTAETRGATLLLTLGVLAMVTAHSTATDVASSLDDFVLPPPGESVMLNTGGASALADSDQQGQLSAEGAAGEMVDIGGSGEDEKAELDVFSVTSACDDMQLALLPLTL